MAGLGEVLDAFDRLVASARGAAPAPDVDEAARVAARARARFGYLGDSVVVALVGGTGSGKSSLVNALAGEEVSPAGAFRPTTSEPLAWIPARPEPGLVRLLDDLGIGRRVGQSSHPWLAVIDLPDTDSVEAAHLATVERILPEVDAVVWVLDPEKYQDRALHRDRLAPLAGHADRFVFALNQVDRVDPADTPALIDDLHRSLAADGISGARVVATAADPALGDPEGIDELVEALRDLGEAKTVVHRKIATDISEAARRLAHQAGADTGSTGFGSDWEQVAARAAARICDDLIGPDQLRRARRRGASRGRAAAGLWPRRLPVGEVDLAARSRGEAGTLEAISILDAGIGGMAERAGGDTAAELRAVAASIDEAVVSTADELVFGETLQLPEPPGWAPAMAWIRRVGLIGLLVAAVWLVDGLRAGGGSLLAPVAAVVAALLVIAVPGAVAAGRAGRAAAAEAERQRADLEAVARRSLDRRLGHPLREALRRRAELSVAFTELELTRRRLE